MNRHERRRVRVIERRNVPFDQIGGVICMWDGCGERFDFHGDMPPGWCYTVMYWAPKADLTAVLEGDPRNVLRDVALCPEHTDAVCRQMKLYETLRDLRALSKPPEGEA
jgi:hypothetical protein